MTTATSAARSGKSPGGHPRGWTCVLLALAALLNTTAIPADTAKDDAEKLLTAAGGLRNISTNGDVDSFGMQAGFIVEGSTRRFAITGEAVGNNLNAALVLTNLDGTITLDSNTRWQNHPTASEIQSSLRPLGRPSDAGFAINLAPGAYVARLYAEDGNPARGLVSVTDISIGGTGGLRNISTNGDTDSFGMQAGFIVEGTTRRFAITGEAVSGNLNAALVLTSLDGSTTFDSNSRWQSHPTASELQSVLRPLGQSSDAGFAINLAPGAYVARLYAEDGNPARGLVSVTDISGFTPQPGPDLTVDNWSINWNTASGDGELQYRVVNQGDTTITDTSWNITLVLSPDIAIGNGNEFFLFTEDGGFVLDPGDAVSRNSSNAATFNLFTTETGGQVPAGTYYIALWVDDQQQISEIDESNNVSLGDRQVEISFGKRPRIHSVTGAGKP